MGAWRARPRRGASPSSLTCLRRSQKARFIGQETGLGDLTPLPVPGFWDVLWGKLGCSVLSSALQTLSVLPPSPHLCPEGFSLPVGPHLREAIPAQPLCPELPDLLTTASGFTEAAGPLTTSEAYSPGLVAAARLASTRGSDGHIARQ